MIKTFKIFISIVIITCIASSFYLLFFPSAKAFEACPFCEAAVLDRQTFYEDDLVLALYTHKPILPGHCLIIPKRHVERFDMLSHAEIAQIGEVIKKVNFAAMKIFGNTSYLLIQKNGKEAWQTVPHMHFHYVPGLKGQPSWKFIGKMWLANMKKPMLPSQMEKIVAKMRKEMKQSDGPVALLQ